MNNATSSPRTPATRLASGAGSIRRRIATAMFRGQLGPSREREWHTFSPGR